MPTYPVLWAHDAVRERTLSFDGESEGLPRTATDPAEQRAVDAKVANVWASASQCHFNRDFRFNSQATAMQFTPRLTMGGRAWVSIKLTSTDLEKILVLWGNSALGILLYWWHANKQQSGRGSIGISALQTLPVLDIRNLDKGQLTEATKLFDEISKKPLLPLHQMEVDMTRIELDTKFFTRVLGVQPSILASGGQLDLLRRKMALEPSICGAKLPK